MVLQANEEGKPVESEVSSASKLVVDLGELRIEGLPVRVMTPKKAIG